MRIISRVPRKKKKLLKKMFKKRYGFDFLKCCDCVIEYMWFFRNPYKFNMHKSINVKNMNLIINKYI